MLSLTVVVICCSASLAADVSGVIARVDLDRHELVLDNVRPKNAPPTVPFDDKTQVLYGKTAGALKDLPVGRHVRVEYEQREGRLVAAVLHVNGRPPVAATPKDDGSLAGTLRRVALSDREIVVIGPGAKGPETETTVAVPETAKVMRDGKAIAFVELTEGEKVAVSAEKHDGRWMAKTIQVGAAPASESKDSKLVPRLRLILKIADGILRQMDSGK
jgi:hypothetical protein